MATFQYPIPGLTLIGVINPNITELVTQFVAHGLSALQTPVNSWANNACNVTPGDFRVKIPVDVTSLNGFQPWAGARDFKAADMVAQSVDADPFHRDVSYNIKEALAGIYGPFPKQGQHILNAARLMKPRMVANVFAKGVPGGTALTYPQQGSPNGLTLFNTAHLCNPIDASKGTFSNYHAAAGAFSPSTFETTRSDMFGIVGLDGIESLGLEVTWIIGPTRMRDPFRKVLEKSITFTTAAVPIGGGSYGAAGAGETNVFSTMATGTRYAIAPQLDSDPYCVANPTKHMWIAISQTLPGAYPVEMIAPDVNMTPKIQVFGEGSEWAAMNKKIGIVADLDIGAAAGIPHVVARYEET